MWWQLLPASLSILYRTWPCQETLFWFPWIRVELLHTEPRPNRHPSMKPPNVGRKEVFCCQRGGHIVSPLRFPFPENGQRVNTQCSGVQPGTFDTRQVVPQRPALLEGFQHGYYITSQTGCCSWLRESTPHLALNCITYFVIAHIEPATERVSLCCTLLLRWSHYKCIFCSICTICASTTGILTHWNRENIL